MIIIINPIAASVNDDTDADSLVGIVRLEGSRFMYLYLLSHWTLYIIKLQAFWAGLAG